MHPEGDLSVRVFGARPSPWHAQITLPGEKGADETYKWRR